MPEFEALKVSWGEQRRRWKALDRDRPELFTIPGFVDYSPGTLLPHSWAGLRGTALGRSVLSAAALQANACRAGFSLFSSSKPDWLLLGAETQLKKWPHQAQALDSECSSDTEKGAKTAKERLERPWRDGVPRTALPKGPASCSETGSTHRVQVPTAMGRGGRNTGLLAFSACLELRSLSRQKPPLSCKSPHLFLFWTYSLLDQGRLDKQWGRCSSS